MSTTFLPALFHLTLIALGRSEGLFLRCCVITERPFLYLDPNASSDRYVGATEKYHRSLAQQVPGGFKCVEKTGIDGDETFVHYEGFSELVNHFAACAPGGGGVPNINTSACACDIGTVSVARNSARYGKVDFVAPMFFDSLAVVQRSSMLETSENTVFFLRPFSAGVWGGIFGLLFLHAFVTIFDRNFSPPASEHAPPPDLRGLGRVRYILLKTKLLRRMRLALFATAFGMSGHWAESSDSPGKVRPRTRQRFIALMAITLGTFLTLVYEAGLVVQLFVEEPVSVFRDVNDMKDCKIKAETVCVPTGGNDAQVWNSSIVPARMINGCDDDNLYPTWTTPDGKKDAYHIGVIKVKEEENTCMFLLASKTTLETAQSQNCGKLSLVGKDFSPNALSYVLPKDSPHTASLSNATLEIQEKGGVEDATAFSIRSLASECVLRSDVSLSWSQLGVFFYVAYGGLGLMMLFLCFGNLLTIRTRRVKENETAVVGSSSGDERDDSDDGMLEERL